MHDQPVLEPNEASDFFADGRGNRMPIEGTVARGQLRDNEAFYTGLSGDQFLAELPVANTRGLLERGQNRYDIFCSPCHSRIGNGRGMIVRRGFKQPASFHEARLRDQPVGYYFDVMSRGFGEMSSYAPLVKAEDRWAIVAYIRALQLSQNVVLADLDEPKRKAIESAVEAQATPAANEAGEVNEETAAHD
ncbi:MAG: cytochrome c [bacterium]|nr:cytochrome c [bacterium]